MEEAWYWNIFSETYAPEIKTAALSHWVDDYKRYTRPALSLRGSDLVQVSIENCPQHILSFLYPLLRATASFVQVNKASISFLSAFECLSIVYLPAPRNKQTKKSGNSLDQVFALRNTIVFRRVAEDMNSVYYFWRQLICYLIVK